MGNCCVRHNSNMVWAGDDWGSPMSKRFTTTTRGSSRCDGYYSDDEKPKKMMRRKNKTDYYEAEEKEIAAEQTSALLVVDDEKNVMMNSSSSTEVKIRITKRQLEELLGNVEVKGLSVHELLEQLMNVNTNITTTTTHDSTIRHHRSWRPALNTIPETIEAN